MNKGLTLLQGKFRSTSILTKFLLIYIVSIVLPLLVIQTISQRSATGLLKSEVYDNLTGMSRQINASIENWFKQMDNLSSLLYSFDLLNNIITTDGYAENSIQLLENNREFDKFFTYLMAQARDIESIFIFTAGGHVFFKSYTGQPSWNDDPKDETWYREVVRADGKVVFFSSPPYPTAGNLHKTFSMARQIKTMDGRTHAVFLLTVNMDAIKSIIGNSTSSYSSRFLILDKEGNDVYNDGQSPPIAAAQANLLAMKAKDGTASGTVNGEDVLLTYTDSAITGWKIVSLTPRHYIERKMQSMQRYSLSTIVISLLVFSSLIVLLYLAIYKPILRLERSMKKVEAGDFNVRVAENSQDEIGRLCANFNRMVRKINDQIEQEYKLTILNKDAEFRALQAQINHHFLFNSLQSISSIAVVNQVPEINRMAQSLGYMLRYSIETNSDAVPFEQELSHVQCYLAIQKIRLDDKVTVDIDIDASVYRFSIMKLLLQPIVENAFNHGFAAKRGKGRLSLSASLIRNQLVLRVSDDGAGMNEDTLNSLRESIERGDPDGHRNGKSSIGLLNVTNRLRLFYGVTHSTEIHSRIGEGTDIVIRIPAISCTE